MAQTVRYTAAKRREVAAAAAAAAAAEAARQAALTLEEYLDEVRAGFGVWHVDRIDEDADALRFHVDRHAALRAA